jgi:PAS domain S-box-containing protein
MASDDVSPAAGVLRLCKRLFPGVQAHAASPGDAAGTSSLGVACLVEAAGAYPGTPLALGDPELPASLCPDDPPVFFAACTSSDGEWVLYLVDSQPRGLSDRDRQALADLAEVLSAQPQSAPAAASNEGDERFRTIVSNSEAGVLVEDEQGTVVLANQRLLDLFAIPAEPSDVIGSSCRASAESVAPLFQAHTAFLESIDALPERGQAVLAERWALADGRVLERDFLPVAGRQRGWGRMWLYRDVTNQVLAERQLEHQRDLLRSLARSLGYLLSDDLESSTFNAFREVGEASDVDRVYFFEVHNGQGGPMMSQRFEWARATVAPELDNPDLQNVPFAEAGFMRWYDELGAGREVGGIVAQMPDTERALLEPQDIVSILVVPVTLRGELRGFVGFDDCHRERSWDDVERATLMAVASSLGEAILRHRERAAIAETERKYRSVVNNVRDIVFQTDAEGNWTFLNPAWELATGFELGQTLGTPFIDYVYPDDRARNEELFRPLIAREKETCRHEVRYRTADGGYRWMEVFAQLSLTDDGEVSGTSGMLHDVTQQREVTRALAEALRRERELGLLKSRFVSMASHELRTPLTTIRSSAELLREFGDQWPADRRATLFERILDKVGHMTELIGEVLTLGRVESGQMPFAPAELDLAELCRGVAYEERAHHGSNRPLHLDLPDEPVVGVADAKLLALLVRNLVSNAIKYSPATTPVEVHLRVDESANGAEVVLEVRDSGIGIDETDHERIFEPFERAEDAENIPGTGLGLPIALRAVQRHGGFLTVRSRRRVGSTFSARFPLYAQVPLPSETDALLSASTS